MKLKSCPCCGGKARVRYTWNKKEKYIVRCTECGFESVACESEKEAEKTWNNSIKCDDKAMFQESLF